MSIFFNEGDFSAFKQVLTEQFIFTYPLPSKLTNIDLNKIQNHVLSFYKEDNRIKHPKYWYRHNYHKINYHQHIGWLTEFLSDHYAVSFNKKPILLQRDGGVTALIQQKNESINSHNHIDPYDYNNSPDLTVLYTVSDTDEKKPTYIVFEYENGRNRHCRWKLPLKKNHFIFFSSTLNHYITKNTNDDLLINLCFNFELV